MVLQSHNTKLCYGHEIFVNTVCCHMTLCFVTVMKDLFTCLLGNLPTFLWNCVRLFVWSSIQAWSWLGNNEINYVSDGLWLHELMNVHNSDNNGKQIVIVFWPPRGVQCISTLKNSADIICQWHSNSAWCMCVFVNSMKALWSPPSSPVTTLFSSKCCW